MTHQQMPFVIDGFPRCGSTTLANVLNLHPDVRCCIEPFHPKRYGGHFNSLALQAKSVRAALVDISLRWNGLKHVWEPGSGWPFEDNCALNDDLIINASSVVWLQRRNLLRQFVSNHISKHLRYWIGARKEFIERLSGACLPPLTYEYTLDALLKMKGATQARAELVKNTATRCVVISYEDLFSDLDFESQVALVNGLFRFLGFSPLDDPAFYEQCRRLLDSNEYRWASSAVYACVPGAAQVDAQLRGQGFGDLF